MEQAAEERRGATAHAGEEETIATEKIALIVKQMVTLANPLRSSRARVNHRPDSDLDLAVIVDRNDPRVDPRPVWYSGLDVRIRSMFRYSAGPRIPLPAGCHHFRDAQDLSPRILQATGSENYSCRCPIVCYKIAKFALCPAAGAAAQVLTADGLEFAISLARSSLIARTYLLELHTKGIWNASFCHLEVLVPRSSTN